MAGFTPEQRSAVAGVGQGIAAVLQDRFHAKQFEDFLQGPYAEYRSQVTGIREQLMKNPDAPDIAATSMMGYKDAMMQLNNEAARFSGNQRISDLITRHMEVDMGEQDKIVGAFDKEKADTQGEEAHEAKVEQTQAQSYEARSRGNLLQTQADAGGFSPSSAQQKNVPLTGKASNLAEAKGNIIRRIGEPAFAAIKGTATLTEAQKYLEENPEVEQKLKGSGMTPSDAIQYIAARYVDPQKAMNRAIYQVISTERPDLMGSIHGDPDLRVFAPTYDEFNDAGRAYEKIPKGWNEIEKATSVAIEMMGEAGIVQLGQATMTDVESITENLPETLTDMGNSPLNVLYRAAAESSGFIPGTDKKFKDQKEMQEWIDQALNQHVAMTAIDVKDPQQRKAFDNLKKAYQVRYSGRIAEMLGLDAGGQKKYIFPQGSTMRETEESIRGMLPNIGSILDREVK